MPFLVQISEYRDFSDPLVVGVQYTFRCTYIVLYVVPYR